MKKHFNFSPIALSFISILTVFSVLLFTEIFPFKERKVYTSLIRLHILPNSQCDEDMQMKYLIRDEVLKESENIFSAYDNVEDAKNAMVEVGEKIEVLANGILERENKTYKAKAVWGKENYPRREYDGFTLPAGEYYSLRILLGEGEGDNWWCVLFPPLCLGASQTNDGFASVGIDGNSARTFTEDKPKYKLKFKLLEWIFG